MGEFSSVYSQNTLNDIKQYLESNIYPIKIASLTCAFMRVKKVNAILEKLFGKINDIS